MQKCGLTWIRKTILLHSKFSFTINIFQHCHGIECLSFVLGGNMKMFPSAATCGTSYANGKISKDV